MRKREVAFGDERLTFDVPGTGMAHFEAWEVAAGGSDAGIGPLVAAALESPLDFPSLRQAVVPGDQVVIALDSDIPAVASVLAPLIEVLHSAGVERESIPESTDEAGKNVQSFTPLGGCSTVQARSTDCGLDPLIGTLRPTRPRPRPLRGKPHPVRRSAYETAYAPRLSAQGLVERSADSQSLRWVGVRYGGDAATGP